MAISKDTLDTIRISELPEATGHADGDLLVVTGGEDFVTRKETVRNFTRNNVTLDGDQSISGKKRFWGGVELGKDATMTCELPGNCPDASVVNAGFVRDNFAKKEHTHTRDEITDLNGLDDVYSRLDHKHKAEDITDLGEFGDGRYSKLGHKHQLQDINDIDKLNLVYSKLDHKHQLQDINDIDKLNLVYSKLDHKHKAEDITDFKTEVDNISKKYDGEGKYVKQAHLLGDPFTDKVGSNDYIYINHNGVDRKMELNKIIYEPPEGVTSLNVYVETNGNDENAEKYITTGGTNGDALRKANPYRTLQAAISDMSRIRSNKSNFTFRVNIGEGTFKLDKQLIITHPDCLSISGNVLSLIGAGIDKTTIDVCDYLAPNGVHRKYEYLKAIVCACRSQIYNLTITNSRGSEIPYTNPAKCVGEWSWVPSTWHELFIGQDASIELSNVKFTNCKRVYFQNCNVWIINCYFLNLWETGHEKSQTIIYSIYFDIHSLFTLYNSSTLKFQLYAPDAPYKTAPKFIMQGKINDHITYSEGTNCSLGIYCQQTDNYKTLESVLSTDSFNFNVKASDPNRTLIPYYASKHDYTIIEDGKTKTIKLSNFCIYGITTDMLNKYFSLNH